MATLTQVGDAGVALAEVLISILLQPLLARCVREPMQCLGVPQLLPSICTTGISSTDVERFPLGVQTVRHAIAYSERLADSGTSGGLRAEYEALVVWFSPLGRTWHAGHIVDFPGQLNSF